MENYICDNCGYSSDDFKDIIRHLEDKHNIIDFEIKGSIEQKDGKLYLKNLEEVIIIDIQELFKSLFV